MPQAELPPHELFRVATLNDYGVLDTPPETQFERITTLAALIMGQPISAVSLIDADRQWFKAARGLEFAETSRAVSFCAHGLAAGAPLTVLDARQDARFADNPFVTDGAILSYFGAPLTAPNGMCLGMLCAAGPEPAAMPSDDQIAALNNLAVLAMRELELQRVGYLWRETSEQSQQEIERRDRIRMRLEHALASRTAFFASLSHEMRTPLHSILGFSDLVNLSSGNPLDVQTFSREVSLAAAKLQDTVDGVLSLSDVPRGGEATKNRFDAARVMADVMRLMGGFAFQRRVVLEAAGASNSCAVVGNSDALRHALLQICINAINASPAGGTVSMSVAATLLNTEISVHNTGPVLTGLECGQALTPLGQPCAAGGEGTGISLPIVRVLIERTGGTISLRGDADSGGTIATVSLLSSL